MMNAMMNAIENFPFVLPNTTWQYVVATLQLLMIATNATNEIHNPSPYSKFATINKQAVQKAIPSKYGMLIAYVPATLISLYKAKTETTVTLASSLVFLHFFKRVLETLFVHKYSGSMDCNTSIAIGTFYSLVSLLIIGTAQPTSQNWLQLQRLGLRLFAVGQIGNLYHHYLLRQLRAAMHDKKDGDSKKRTYMAPTGGLFNFVACPHYLFEIVGFLGIAFASLHLHALFVACGMASYLCGRAINTLKFYQATFSEEEWPRERKALVPFVF